MEKALRRHVVRILKVTVKSLLSFRDSYAAPRNVSIELEAEVGKGEDPDKVVAALALQVEAYLQQSKQVMITAEEARNRFRDNNRDDQVPF